MPNLASYRHSLPSLSPFLLASLSSLALAFFRMHLTLRVDVGRLANWALFSYQPSWKSGVKHIHSGMESWSTIWQDCPCIKSFAYWLNANLNRPTSSSSTCIFSAEISLSVAFGFGLFIIDPRLRPEMAQKAIRPSEAHGHPFLAMNVSDLLMSADLSTGL